MTLDQFKSCSEIEKVSAILEHGRLMAQGSEDGSRIFLYKLGTFYVSASYSNHNDQLTEITCYLEVEQAVPHFRKKLILIDPAEREYQTPDA